MMTPDTAPPALRMDCDAGAVAPEVIMQYLFNLLFSFFATGIGEDPPPVEPVEPQMGPEILPGI